MTFFDFNAIIDIKEARRGGIGLKNKEKAFSLLLVLHLLLTLLEWITLSALGVLFKSAVFIKISEAVLTAVRFFIPVYAYVRVTGYRPLREPLCEKNSESVERSKSNVLTYIFALSVTVTLLNLAGLLSDAFFSLFGRETASASSVSVLDAVYTFIKSVLLASVLEETLFRGAFFHAFSERSERERVFLSALVFALMHCNGYQFLYALVAGALIAAFTAATGSLLLAVSVHFGANLVTFIFSLLKVWLSDGVYTAVSVTVLAVFAAVSALSGIVFFRRYLGEKMPVRERSSEPLPRELYIYIAASALISVINLF